MNLKYILILVSILVGNILLSVYVFTNGFLIRRLALNNTNTQSFSDLKRFNKTVVLFVDALRFDFIFTTKNSLFGIPTIEKLLKNDPQNSKLFKFIADPPTTTMQRIKALMSGTLPTFIDAGSNFDSYLIEDDNLIQQSYLNNKSVIILGDDTWLSLFSEDLLAQHFTHPSFNIKDLDSNDIGVNEKLTSILSNSTVNWNFIVAHYLGLDHCGHTFGPKSPVIKRKLNDIDKTIRFVTESIDEETLLVVIGDHGMTETGDHGGDSKLELESALFFYSRLSLQNTKKLVESTYKEVRQINLTPTLALLLGIPIPYSNLGIVIEEMFEQDEIHAFHANYLQIHEFITKYEALTNEEFIDKNSYNLNLTEFNHNLANGNNIDEKVRQDFQIYLNLVQDACRQKWSTFNIDYCVLGLVLIAVSILNLFLFVNTEFKHENYLEIISIKYIKLVLLFASIYLTISLLFKSNMIMPVISLLFNTVLLCSFKNTLENLQRPFSLIKNVLKPEYFLYSLLLVIPFSNSFIVQENVSLRYVLISILFFELFIRLRCSPGVSTRFGMTKFAEVWFISALIRLTEIFYVCREEALLLKCSLNIFSTQLTKISFNGDQNAIIGYFGFVILNFTVMSSVILYLLKSNSIKFVSNINFMIVVKMFLLLGYWILQLVINVSEIESDYKLHKIGLVIARTFYVCFIVIQAMLLSNNSIELKSNYVRTVIYSMISWGLLISILAGESVMSIWILIMIFQIFKNYRESWKLIRNDERVDFILVLVVLQYYFFYASGHETSFTHIKWEAGFHGFEGDNKNPFIKLLTMIFILLNTYSSVVIVITGGFSLLNFAYLFQCDTYNQLEYVFIRSVLKIFLFIAVKIFMSALSVFVLRRHLMVWKIFAPRFVFEAVGFFFTCAMSTLAILIFFKVFMKNSSYTSLKRV